MKKITLSFLLATLWITFAAVAEDAKSEVVRKPVERDGFTTKVVYSLASKHHYNNPTIDDDVSAELFANYFRMLDPNHYYFLASDVSFFSRYRKELDDQIRDGDVRFAFIVFERFLQRIEDRVEFVRAHVNDPFDFSKDETVLVDRTEETWAKDVAELDEVWRKRIKNQLLVEEILAEEMKAKEAAGENKDEDNKFAPDQRDPKQKVIRRYEQYLKFFKGYDTADVMEYYLTALLNLFDPHSNYLNWRSLEDFDIQMKLSLQGIGATLKSVDGYTEVVNVIAGGPADADGRLQPGDRIIAVGQGSDEPVGVVDMPLNKVVRLIRGKKSTEVRLTVQKSQYGVPEIITIIRDEVKLTEQEAQGEVTEFEAEGGRKLRLGVLDIPSFYADFAAQRAKKKDAKSTSADSKRIIEDMMKEPLDGLLVDLRSNGGGSLEEAIRLTGLFIPEGPVVQVQRSGNKIQVREDRDRGFAFDMPLVVLTNRSSASASEIFSGAIKDYGRGVVVGDATTHGKGTVQTVFYFNQMPYFRRLKAGAMKYTMAKFYRITGASTQKQGVQPDIVVPSFFDHMEIGEAHLKHVMPWDEIRPAEYVPAAQNVTRLVPELTTRMTKREAADQGYIALANDIKRFGERQEQDTITLNKDKRKALRKEDEFFAERSRAVLKKNRDDEEEKEDDVEDLYLKRGLAVLADLVVLSERDKLTDGGAR